MGNNQKFSTFLKFKILSDLRKKQNPNQTHFKMDLFWPMVVYLLWSWRAENHLTLSFWTWKNVY